MDVDLATSFPKPDSLLPGLIPKSWFEWKDSVYEDTGLQLALSYQSLIQRATDIRPLADTKTACAATAPSRVWVTGSMASP